jgi:hypothetical protein
MILSSSTANFLRRTESFKLFVISSPIISFGQCENHGKQCFKKKDFVYNLANTEFEALIILYSDSA